MNKFPLILMLAACFSAHGAVGIQRAVCVEKEESLLKEFLPTSFNRDRSTVGQDQVEIIKTKIQEFVVSHPEVKITKVSVKSMSARVPFYIEKNKKKVIDPDSDLRNSKLAEERATFINKLMVGMKTSKPELKEVQVTIESGIAGPEFKPTDLNDRFVTPMSENYKERVEDFYNKNKELYKNVALKNSPEDLLKEEQFPNLYQVKFKPFQGFSLEVSGFKKCEEATLKEKLPSAIKQ